MPRLPLRIAVLLCDTPPEPINTRYDGLGGLFTRLFNLSAQELHKPQTVDPASIVSISRFDVVTAQEYPDLDNFDALLLTGSKHDSFADHPWILKLVEFTKKALAHPSVKLLGVCFGHQIIARAMGYEVGRNSAGWEISVCGVDLTEKGRELFGVETLKIQQMHRDIVYTCPDGVVPLGRTPTCEVQGMYKAGKFITVQGHPEYKDDIMSEVVTLRAAAGIFDKEQAEDALNRAGNPHDGVAIATAFLKFLLE
ncbi:hypothetical protein ASPVEDRAFT_120074 [Aspergillus versicolor CBS 583.65]|uniref:Glutamine amidotransferase domain-containing protein n=1 Tax=Aspergillus versicolor CBS 583.65 TaxID=1036611 RepID=A0A1L9P3V8_ASPVE|nr:uncharacterized protein ASPVEDRAFT_120074 [Aspergillus versicolor CBS 583.65]OJI96192.1 hypothetical protein ASPVEDRAFT_120074 [Aspergillus versicolor CBS 583.65]